MATQTARRIFATATMLLPVFLLPGCGDSGGFSGGVAGIPVEPPIEELADIGGIWQGRATDSVNALTPQDIVIYTTADGRFRLASDFSVQAIGLASAVNDPPAGVTENFVAEIRAFAPTGFFFSDGSETSLCRLTAVFVERVSLDGSYACDNGDTGDFTASYSDRYELGASTRELEGIWGNSNLVFTVTPGGLIAGQTGIGCDIGGSIDPVDNNFNMYDVRINLVNCGELNGTYDGLGAFSPELSQPDRFSFQVDNGLDIITELVIR